MPGQQTRPASLIRLVAWPGGRAPRARGAPPPNSLRPRDYSLAGLGASAAGASGSRAPDLSNSTRVKPLVTPDGRRVMIFRTDKISSSHTEQLPLHRQLPFTGLVPVIYPKHGCPE